MNALITSTDLLQKIHGYLETLALETDQARQSEEMKRFLEFVAKFHNYSPNNIFLIMLAKPDATHVMGFNSWKKLNRFVKRGEHGIPIFAPMIHKEDPDKEDSPKVLNGFRVVYVFDVSQTDGEPLPPIPDWKSPEKNAELNAKLIRFAESKGITVTYKELPGEIQGVSKGGAIDLSPNAGTKTLFHELAHELMHHGIDGPNDRNVIEMEAESVAYAIAKHFGFQNLNCINYLALYNISRKDISQSINRIVECVELIIQGISS
jgi:hypothetical protein